MLSHEQWQAWQAEVGRTAEHLGRQWDRLAGFQARQAALHAELQADIETLVLAAAEVRDDPALPPDWRQDLDSALRGRVGDLQVALTVAVQLGEATDQLRNHQLMQGRLQVAAGLLVHAAQTGRTLQQALADQVRLQALPPFSSAFSPDSPDQE